MRLSHSTATPGFKQRVNRSQNPDMSASQLKKDPPYQVSSAMPENDSGNKVACLISYKRQLSYLEKRISIHGRYLFLTIGIFILFLYLSEAIIQKNQLMSYSENIKVLSRKKQEESILIPPLKRKKKLFKSKIDYALHTNHMHYFTKKEVLDYRKSKSSKSIIEPRCVLCGLRLTQYRTQIQYETMDLPAYKDGK